jgi:hypothetical protein
MDRGPVLVLLSGVRDDIARAMHDLRFDRWLPAVRVYASDPRRPGSSTVDAVRFAYGRVTPAAVRACPHCYGLTAPADGQRSALYYVV